jgi:type I restriction enzyme M protein
LERRHRRIGLSSCCLARRAITRCSPIAERCRDLTQQVDLAAKLAGRAIDIRVKELEARESDLWTNADVNRARRALEEARSDVVEVLRLPRYFVKQADWLQDRFPEARLRHVEGQAGRPGRNRDA